MKFNKTLFFLTIIVSIVAMAGVAFAANTIEVTVQSEPMPYDETVDPATGEAIGYKNTTCSKAGGYSFGFDADTEIKPGDRVTVDLNLGATLCRDIDIMIHPVGGGGWTEATIGTNAEDAPVFYQNEDPAGGTEPNGDYIVNNGGVYFRVYGIMGSRKVTFDVLGEADAFIRVGNEAGDQLSVVFLDGRTNTEPDGGFATDGIWVDRSVPKDGTYESPASVAENTFCVDASKYTSETCNANLDSRNDKYAFSRTDPQVFHPGETVQPIPPDTILEEQCKYTVGSIPIPAEQDRCIFDFETKDGYCPDHSGNHRFILSQRDGTNQNIRVPFDSTRSYQVSLEILVNGQSGNNGVHWADTNGRWDNDQAATSESIGVVTAANLDTICADADDLADELFPVDTYNLPAAPDIPTVGCVYGDNATVVTTNQHDAPNFGLPADNIVDRYMWTDFPTFHFDRNDVSAGDRVSVLVTLTVYPSGDIEECGDVQQTASLTYTVDVGTFTNKNCQGTLPFSLVYPYFTEDGGDWWNGVAISNLTDKVGKATMMFYEEDGDQGQVTVDVPAFGIYAQVKENILSLPGMVTTPVGATLGNSRAYMVLCTDFNVDGFVLMGNYDTGVGQGYIPRLPTVRPDVCP